MKFVRSREFVSLAPVFLMLSVAPFVFYAGPGSFIVPRLLVVEFCTWAATAFTVLLVPRQSPIRLPLLTFILVCILSMAASREPLACLKTAFFFITGAAIAWSISRTATDKRHLRVIVGMILTVGTIMAAHGILQYFSIDLPMIRGTRFRVFATAGTPAALAGTMAACLCLASVLVIDARRTWSLWLIVAIWSLMATCLLLTYSRSGIASAVVGCITATALIARSSATDRRRAVKRFLLCVAGVVFVTTASTGILSVLRDGSQKIVSPASIKDGFVGSRYKRDSLRQREFTLRMAGRMWLRHPILGNGPGAFSRLYPRAQASAIRELSRPDEWQMILANRIAPHAHNEYAELAVEIGLVGLAAFLLLVAWAGAAMIRTTNTATDDRVLLCGVAGAFAALLTQCGFEFTLHDPLTGMLFWTLLGVGSAAGNKNQITYSRFFRPVAVSIAAVAIVMMMLAPRPFLAMMELRKANQLGTLRQIAAAMQALNRAVALDPASPEVFAGRAGARTATGDFNGAIEDLQTALRFDDGPEMYVALGHTYAFAGLMGPAERSLRTALAIDPWKAGAHYDLGQIYYYIGRRDKAIRELRRALQLDPNLAPAAGLLKKWNSQ